MGTSYIWKYKGVVRSYPGGGVTRVIRGSIEIEHPSIELAIMEVRRSKQRHLWDSVYVEEIALVGKATELDPEEGGEVGAGICCDCREHCTAYDHGGEIESDCCGAGVDYLN